MGGDRVEAPHRIFFIRHGQTDWNIEHRLQGTSDVPLNATGEEQARRVALRLAKIAPARILSSPLSRAKRTAEIVAEGSESPTEITTVDELREFYFGAWEGLTYEEAAARDPERFRRSSIEPLIDMPDGAETLDSARGRIERAASAITDGASIGGVTFVFAHALVLRAVIGRVLGIEGTRAPWCFRLDNCSISIVDHDRQRSRALIINDTAHMRVRADIIGELSFF